MLRTSFLLTSRISVSFTKSQTNWEFSIGLPSIYICLIAWITASLFLSAASALYLSSLNFSGLFLSSLMRSLTNYTVTQYFFAISFWVMYWFLYEWSISISSLWIISHLLLGLYCLPGIVSSSMDRLIWVSDKFCGCLEATDRVNPFLDLWLSDWSILYPFFLP